MVVSFFLRTPGGKTAILTLVAGLALAAAALGQLVQGDPAAAGGIPVAAGEVIVNPNGACSLVEAITNANNDAMTYADCPAGSGADTITLPAGSTFTLSGFVDTTDGQNGLPAITSEIEIEGNGATIERDETLDCVFDEEADPGEFRIFYVGTGGDLTLDSVTVTGGCADGPGEPAPIEPLMGGGIFNRGNLTINGSTLAGNFALADGGAIMNLGHAEITDSTLEDNFANLGGAVRTGDVFILTETRVVDNTARFGGGIYGYGTTTVSGGEISGNQAFDSGGGIYLNSLATASLTGVTLASNLANTGGGVLANNAALDITRSTFSGNTAHTGGGGLYAYSTETTIVESTFAGNLADGAVGNGVAAGAGIVGGRLVVTNSTFSGNEAVDLGGALAVANLLAEAGTAEVSNSTFADNLGDPGATIWVAAGNTAKMKNSVIGNTPGNDCEGPGTLVNLGGNFATDDSCTGFTKVTAEQLALGPLADNGGPTMTHALGPGSVAVDAVTDCTAADGSTAVAQDQRGTPRPQGPACDSGAYELATGTPTPAPTPGGVKGDVDCSGIVDAVDALRILRYAAGLNPNLPAGCGGIATALLDAKGNMDCDDDVDAVDALRILRYVAGLDPNLPAGCPPIGGPGGSPGAAGRG